jgi:hypothetical protein
MRRSPTVLHGLVAGAAGTAVLNTVTYLDVAIRGRPTSSVPADTVDRLTDMGGISLGEGGAGDDGDDERAANRREGIGALLGHATGLGLGVAYGLVRAGPARRVPLGVAGVGLGVAAMASTDIPSTALGVSDPRTWGVGGWLADIVPHVFYGLAVAAVFDELHGRPPARRSRFRR